jgi:hypothetical protein
MEHRSLVRVHEGLASLVVEVEGRCHLVGANV